MKTNETGVLQGSEIFFCTPSSLAKSMYFYPLCMGHFFCNELYHVKRDYFDNFLLMYIKSGKAFVEYEGKSIVAKPGDAVFLDCKKKHSYGSIKKLETLWLHFDGNVSGSFFQLLYERTGASTTLTDGMAFTKTLASIIEGYEKGSLLPEATVSYHIHKLLSELVEAPSKKEKSLNQEDAVNDAIDFILENFHKKLSMEHISKAAHLSPYHLSRIFKVRTGYSPYEYILMVRLNHAKHLLKSSELQIKDIAFKTGFFSESNFTVAFKSQIGITPSEFRRISF